MPIAKHTARKMLIEAGAERVSEEAAEALIGNINQFAYALARKAVMLAKHARRKTIKKIDIDLAK